MRAAVFSFITLSPNSKIPSTRIATYLGAQVKADVIDHAGIATRTPWDVLFLVNGAFAFCKHLEPLAQAIRTARRVIWVQNDYTIIIPKPTSQAASPFRAAFRERREAGLPDVDLWTTIRPRAKTTPLSAYVNWNALTFTPLRRHERSYAHSCSEDTLLYYGSFRQNRVRYFDRFFARPRVKTVIRTMAERKFAEHFIPPHDNLLITAAIPQDGFLGHLTAHGLGLYLEDRKSHEEFHSPANRFYEMLSAGLPMAFQEESAPQLRKAGFDVSDYVVETPRQLKSMMLHRRMIGQKQFKKWALYHDHYGEVAEQVRKAWRTLRSAL